MNCKRCRCSLTERVAVWRGAGGVLASDPFCFKCSDKMDTQVLASHPPVSHDPRLPSKPMHPADLRKMNELVCDREAMLPIESLHNKGCGSVAKGIRAGNCCEVNDRWLATARKSREPMLVKCGECDCADPTTLPSLKAECSCECH